ncbi:MAG: hypothetical protein WD055_03545 [Candidatus Dependentiae bacterium]
MDKKTLLSGVMLACMIGVILLAMFSKLSLIVGVDNFSFSLSHCLLPLLGSLFGVTGCFALFSSLFAVRFISGALHFAYCGVPTLCASLAWTRYARLLNLFIPAVAMILFVAHPVGSQAMAYACFWFIPMIIALFKLNNRFFTALASTFLAHAVGSVMHLYVVNSMTPAAWMQLIPVVALERLIAAMGMYVVITSAHMLLNFVVHAVKSKQYKRSESVLH